MEHMFYIIVTLYLVKQGCQEVQTEKMKEYFDMGKGSVYAVQAG